MALIMTLQLIINYMHLQRRNTFGGLKDRTGTESYGHNINAVRSNYQRIAFRFMRTFKKEAINLKSPEESSISQYYYCGNKE